MTCSFACPVLGKLIFLPSFPPFKCPGWDREKPYTPTGDTLLLRAPGAWQADDAQQVRSARQESGASRPSDLSMDFVASQAVSSGMMVSGSSQFRRTVAGGL